MARELFTPTDEQRGMVKAFAAYGVQQDEIARYLEIDPKTLRKHFRSNVQGGAKPLQSRDGRECGRCYLLDESARWLARKACG
jgi:hypothetical protein